MRTKTKGHGELYGTTYIEKYQDNIKQMCE